MPIDGAIQLFSAFDFIERQLAPLKMVLEAHDQQ